MKKIFLILLTVISSHVASFSSVSCTGGNWVGGDFISGAAYGFEGLYVLSTGTTPTEILLDLNRSFAGIVSADEFLPDGITGEAYAFGVLGNQNADIENLVIADCDLTEKNGNNGAITVNFTGVSNLSYVAYCGGELLSYTYDGTNLSISYESITAAGSMNNPVGGQKLFGLIIVCNTNDNFGASVFRTDMYWEDIKFQEIGEGTYGDINTSMMPGSNFSGENTKEINFNFYVQQSVLENLSIMPVTKLERCSFKFKKESGEDISPNKTIKYYTTDGQVTTWGGNTINGNSTFDFNGNGTDNYIDLSSSNASWSSANGYIYGEEETAITESTDNKANVYVSENGTLNIECEECIGNLIGLYTATGKCIEKTIMNTSRFSYKNLTKGSYILTFGSNSQQFVIK